LALVASKKCNLRKTNRRKRNQQGQGNRKRRRESRIRH
jgi:hypothetical protein